MSLLLMRAMYIIHHEYNGRRYIINFWRSIISLVNILYTDACLSLGVSSAKTFTALNPLLCQAIGGTLNSSTLCKINASPFEFNV